MDKRQAVRLAAPFAIPLLLIAGWVAALVYGPTFTVLLVSFVFAATFLFVPMLGYVVKATTPRFIAEPLAALVVSVGLGGLGRAVMEYADGRYEKRLLEADEDYPEGAYYNVGLGELAFVYDRSNGDLDAWTDDVDLDALAGDEVRPNKVDSMTTRNGLKEFVDTSISKSAVLVYAAEVLSQWRDSASIEDAHIGENKARHEHNVEASSTDRTLGDRVEWFILFASGITIGFIFFF